MLLGLFTGFLSYGGIDRVGRHVAAVLAGYAEQCGEPYRFYTLNDPRGKQTIRVNGRNFEFYGFQRAKTQFVLASWKALLSSRLAYMGHPNLASLGLVGRMVRPDMRYIVTGHGIDVWSPISWLRRTGLRRATIVTAPSKFTADKMVSVQSVPPSKVRVLPWSLDPDLLKANVGDVPRTSLPLGRLILTVSRLTKDDRYKGVEQVIQAMSQVLAVVPDARYLIVGDGEDRPWLENLARNIGVSGHVSFMGVCSDEELIHYYQACEVFVLPSQKEGFGLVFLEAMALGKPIVASDYGATPEVVSNGKTGFLIGSEGIEGLAQRIVQLLTNPKLRAQMGTLGKQRVQSHYTFDTFERNLIAILEESRSL